MDENEIFSRVKDVIAEQLGIDDLDTITSETTFIDDLGADSLDVVELIMAFVWVIFILILRVAGIII